jgi:hypothetical protein
MRRKTAAGVRRYNKVTVRTKRPSLTVLSPLARHLIRQRFQPTGVGAGDLLSLPNRYHVVVHRCQKGSAQCTQLRKWENR